MEEHDMAFDIPTDIDFDVAFEPTKLDDKKYVINATTGEPLAIVGQNFKCASHGDFYREVYDTVTQEFSQAELLDAKFKWRTAHNGGWSLLDITLPNMVTRIETEQHSTELGNRIIALHGIDGTCSNQVYFGQIDFFCTNGMIRGEYDKIRRKNTANFTLSSFIFELARARRDFYEEASKMQVWAETKTNGSTVLKMLEDMLNSERKAEKMYHLYLAEAATRGHNKWALYSAFTNYASYADDRNGFNLKNTGNDTQSISMWKREHEVSQWISDKRFIELEAA
jgi:hypothetical protein